MSRLPSLGPRGEGWVAIQLLLFAAIAAAGIALSGSWTGPGASLATIAGWTLLAAGGGLAFAGLAGLHAGDALTAVPHPRDEARLVETGAYRFVRHPIYGGLIIMAAGWGLTRHSVPALLGAVALLVFFDLKRRREEAWLRARFADYADYASRARRLIPWLY